MENKNMPDKEKEAKRVEEMHEKIEQLLEELRKDDRERIPSFEEFMKARNKREFGSNVSRRKDLVFTDAEKTLFQYIKTRSEELKIEGIFDIPKIYASLPDELREELIHHEIAYKNGRRIRFQDKLSCILRFLAYEEDYPLEIQEEILNCIYKLQNSFGLNSDNRIIVAGVLEDLVNHDWSSLKIWNKSVKTVKEGMSHIIGQKSSIDSILKYYNILCHTRKPGPHIIRIKACDGMGANTLVKAFADSVGRYCEIGCQNLGYDPEVTAGSSRVYCNSMPGRLAEAIIRYGMQVIVLKNVNEADDRNLGRLSAFFENTFVDNYYHIKVPGDVLVICTESKTGKEAPEYLFKDAYTIEIEEYSEEDCVGIMNNLISKYNDEFGLELSFNEEVIEKITESKIPGEIHKKILDVFSNISFQNEFSESEAVIKKLVTLADIK